MTHNKSTDVVNKPSALLFIDFILLVIIVASVVLIPKAFAVQLSTQPDNEDRLLLDKLSLQIDGRIGEMKLIAKSIANDPFIHDWVEQGFAEDKEALLLEKLQFFVDEYALTSASFADKNTNKYWNHEGFLRVLDPEIDTWYFAYLKSGAQDLISVYHDQNKKRVDIYVNYQQVTGNGLSGIATSFDGVFEMLSTSNLNRNGSLYLLNSTGDIQVHSDKRLSEINEELGNISDVVSGFAIEEILTSGEPSKTVVHTNESMSITANHLPNMNGYLILIKPLSE